MAMTMTRTRTQTTLTKLATLIAEVHGELAFVEELLADSQALTEAQQRALQMRQKALDARRQALHLTLRQFDQALDPDAIRASDQWRKAYGQGRRDTLVRRYLTKVEAGP